MANNRANKLVPKQIVDKVLSALQTIKTDLEPYNIPLTATEKKELFKMGDKSIGFVNKAGDYVETNPEFVPFYLDVPALRIDLQNVNNINPLLKLAEQVTTILSDLVTLSGHEALDAALDYYAAAKSGMYAAAPNAKEIYGDLKERFPGKKSK